MKKIIFVLATLSLLAGGCGNNEGSIQTTDCREQIYTNADSYDATVHSYTCFYDKNTSGQIVGSACSRVELDSQGKCSKSWTYETGSMLPQNH